MNKVLRLMFACSCLSVALAHAQSLEETIQDCNDCHGADGVSQHGDVPTIAGQSTLVIEDALIAYADEDRACVSSEYRHGEPGRDAITMCAVAQGLGEGDVVALAEHYAGLPFVAAAQDFNPDQVEKGGRIHKRNCEKCHSDGGSNAEDDAGILAGQWTEFLRNTIEEYQAGDRPMSKKMKEKMDLISEEDFEALLNFYASQDDQG